MSSAHYSREMIALLGRIVEQTLIFSLFLLIFSLVLLLPLAYGVLIAAPTPSLSRLLTLALAGLIVVVGACLLLFPFSLLLWVRQERDVRGGNPGTVVAAILSIGILFVLLHLWPASILPTFGGSGLAALVWMGALDLLLVTGTVVGKVLHYVAFTSLSGFEEKAGELQQEDTLLASPSSNTSICERISRDEQRSRFKYFCSSKSMCSGHQFVS